jgi:predicted GNAT family acetyltransferase
MNEQQPAGGQPAFVHNEPQSRYELHLDGRLAGQAQYRREGGHVRFTHTEVDPGHQGQGLASRLAGFALDDLKARGLKAVPQCPFIAKYIARHAQAYGELVAR